MQRLGDIGKNGRKLFNRPKPTVGCSANGRRRNIYIHHLPETVYDRWDRLKYLYL
jgi:hypothetical protein